MAPDNHAPRPSPQTLVKLGDTLLAEEMPQATATHNTKAIVHAFQSECGAPPLQHRHFLRQIGQGEPSLWSEVENAAMAAEPSKEPPLFSSPTPSPDNFVFKTHSIGGKSMVENEMQLSGSREPPTAIQNTDGVCFENNTHSLQDTEIKDATCEQYELATRVLIDLGVIFYYTHALSTLNGIPHLVDSQSLIGSAGGAGYLIASLLGLGLVLLHRRGRAVLGCRPLLGIATLAIPLCWGSHDSVTTTDGTTCLTITDDVFRGNYREFPNGCAIITAGCNELERKAFRKSNLKTLRVEYSTTPLKIGEEAFQGLDDELTLIKTCESGCGDCSSVRCNENDDDDDECTDTCTCTTRALTLDRRAFRGVIVTFEAACNSYPLSPPPLPSQPPSSPPPPSPPSPPSPPPSPPPSSPPLPPPPSPPSPPPSPPSPPSPPLHPGSRYASSSWELTAALGDDSVDRVLVLPGTYEFTGDMCPQSAICINRAVTIEAEVPGGVVLDAKGGRRVFFIQHGGTAELVGLNITGGFIADKDGGGLYIDLGGVANLKGCNIYRNTAKSRGGGIRLKGVANLEGCNIHSNSAKDGGGVLVDRGGEATLVNTNVYANAAETVCWLSNLSSIFKPAHRPTYSSLPMIPLHCLNS